MGDVPRIPLPEALQGLPGGLHPGTADASPPTGLYDVRYWAVSGEWRGPREIRYDDGDNAMVRLVYNELRKQDVRKSLERGMKK